MKYRIKIVPNDQPDEDGQWVTFETDVEPKAGDTHLVGMHIVQVSTDLSASRKDD